MGVKTIKDNPMKFLSVKWSLWGAFIIGLLPIILEKGMNLNIIPSEYHAIIVSVVLPSLTIIGRVIHQPELHTGEENE